MCWHGAAMSEYQYYEFQAVDRPLTDADRKMLRGIKRRTEVAAWTSSGPIDSDDVWPR